MPPVLSRISDRVASVSPRRQPYMVRRNYALELRSAATFPLAAALAEGTFTGVVASKYFHAGPLLIAVITAAPMFGNILALFWSELAEDRRKVPFINVLQIGLVAAMALVGLTVFLPVETGAAGVAFAGLIIVARVLASGVVTLRSAVWRLNYPRALRAQLIGRIQGVNNTVLAAMVLVAAFALDARPAVYAVLYPIVALISLFGVLSFSRVRVRGERALLRRARLLPAAVGDDEAMDTFGGATPDYRRVVRDKVVGSPLGRLAARFRDAFKLLGEDRMFREYQWWQFILGISFMMMFPSLIYIVSTEMTDPRTQYVLAVFVVQFVPMVTGVVFLQLWAPLFDRVDLLRFRVYMGSVSLLAHVLILAGAVTDSLWIIGAGMFAVGASMGGGQLAWQLGQNAFATRETVGRYMGLHVMLTGIRGMFAPFVGVGIYHLLNRYVASAGLTDAPGGRWVFLASVTAAAVGLVGYVGMSRKYRAEILARDDALTDAVPTPPVPSPRAVAAET